MLVTAALSHFSSTLIMLLEVEILELLFLT